MDVEKLIEQLKNLEACAYGYHINGEVLGMDCSDFEQIMVDAADEISKVSTLQAENEQLRAEMSQARESLDFARTKDAEILRLGMELGHLKKHMERLTHRLGNGELTCNMARDDCREMGGDCQIDSKILDRLAAYEETGLEPEEIGELAVKMEAARPYKAFFEDLVDGQKLSEALSYIRYFAQADMEGRCVVMPCQPGDKVSYKSSTGFWCNAVIKDYTPENIFITAETEIPNAEPLSHTFSILEIEAALRREKE